MPSPFDLLDDNADAMLLDVLKPDDVLILASASAPCKDLSMLQDNLKMIDAVTKALSKVSPAHVIYVSSDAVYRDSRAPINETSCAEPESFHGIMHLVREIALKQCCLC
jgi:nucleoside-diphosphate-sugar epimerase